MHSGHRRPTEGFLAGIRGERAKARHQRATLPHLFKIGPMEVKIGSFGLIG